MSPKKTRDIKRVLIIRSCRMRQFYSNLATLKENIGREVIIDVLTDVLIQPEVEGELRANKEINEVLIYNKGFFKVKDIPQELWHKIQENYDAIVILYGNPCWKGYHQINEVARLSKARYIIGIGIYEEIFIISRKLWWLKRLEMYLITPLILGSVVLLPLFAPIILIGRLVIYFVVYGVGKVRKPLLFEETLQKLPKQKMKILYLGLIGSIHFEKWMRYFVERGHEVHLISILPVSKSPNFNIQNVNLHILKRTRVILPWTSPLTSSLLVDALLSLGRLKKLIEKISPDILHVHHFTPCAFAFALTNFHPFVLTIWDVGFSVEAKRSLISKWITRFVLKNSDLITGDAEHIKELLIESGVNSEKIKLINFGVDTQKFTPGHKDDRLLKELEVFDSPTIISLRTLSPLYNVGSLIRAVPLVLRKVPEAKFIIVGDGSEEIKLKRLANSLGVSGSIRFVGYFPNDELPLCLRSMDIYVSTSLSDGGIAACTAEAMACGLPVIITDFGDNRKWVKNGVNGFIIPLRNPETLASKIICLIRDKGLREKFGRLNRQIIEERNDWKKEMGKMEKLYERPIEGSERG